MPTVFKLITSFCQDHKISLPDKDMRQAIGQQVIKEWFRRKIKCTLSKIESKEPEGTCTVISYPFFFEQTILNIISISLTNNPYQTLSIPLYKGIRKINTSANPLDKGSGTLPENTQTSQIPPNPSNSLTEIQPIKSNHSDRETKPLDKDYYKQANPSREFFKPHHRRNRIPFVSKPNTFKKH